MPGRAITLPYWCSSDALTTMTASKPASAFVSYSKGMSNMTRGLPWDACYMQCNRKIPRTCVELLVVCVPLVTRGCRKHLLAGARLFLGSTQQRDIKGDQKAALRCMLQGWQEASVRVVQDGYAAAPRACTLFTVLPWLYPRQAGNAASGILHMHQGIPGLLSASTGHINKSVSTALLADADVAAWCTYLLHKLHSLLLN